MNVVLEHTLHLFKREELNERPLDQVKGLVNK